MTSNAKLYCNMIEMIEKKRNKVVVAKKQEKNLKSIKSQEELLKKYDDLLLEKYKNLEKMLEKDQWSFFFFAKTWYSSIEGSWVLYDNKT